jgi:hypothetical protein
MGKRGKKRGEEEDRVGDEFVKVERKSWENFQSCFRLIYKARF